MMAKRAPTKKERAKARKEARQRAEEQARRDAGRRRIWLLVVLLVTLAGAYSLYEFLDYRALAGIVLLAGFGVWLAIALAGVGGAVKPRDRRGASSIDYGNR